MYYVRFDDFMKRCIETGIRQFVLKLTCAGQGLEPSHIGGQFSTKHGMLHHAI